MLEPERVKLADCTPSCQLTRRLTLALALAHTHTLTQGAPHALLSADQKVPSIEGRKGTLPSLCFFRVAYWYASGVRTGGVATDEPTERGAAVEEVAVKEAEAAADLVGMAEEGAEGGGWAMAGVEADGPGCRVDRRRAAPPTAATPPRSTPGPSSLAASSLAALLRLLDAPSRASRCA